MARITRIDVNVQLYPRNPRNPRLKFSWSAFAGTASLVKLLPVCECAPLSRFGSLEDVVACPYTDFNSSA
jgi:hypothetical protein